MSISKNLISLSLAAITLPALHGAPHCPGNVASLTLRLVQSSQIVVPIEINRAGPYDFLLDTGAQVTTIEPSLASELHLRPRGSVGVSGVATYARSSYVYLEQIEAGSHSVQNSVAVIQELTQLKAADRRIRGILGGNFLEHFDLLIDNGRRILCLDESSTLATAVKGEHIPLAEPRGSQKDLPFTRPILITIRLSAEEKAPVVLRLDSGSNVPLLFAANARSGKMRTNSIPQLKRVVNGIAQTFAVLPPQDIQIGKRSVRQVSFAIPLNAVGDGPNPREDGLLPTIAFHRVFISCSGGYVALEPWER
jgi:Aspartyl protease